MTDSPDQDQMQQNPEHHEYGEEEQVEGAKPREGQSAQGLATAERAGQDPPGDPPEGLLGLRFDARVAFASLGRCLARGF